MWACGVAAELYVEHHHEVLMCEEAVWWARNGHRLNVKASNLGPLKNQSDHSGSRSPRDTGMCYSL